MLKIIFDAKFTIQQQKRHLPGTRLPSEYAVLCLLFEPQPKLCMKKDKREKEKKICVAFEEQSREKLGC